MLAFHFNNPLLGISYTLEHCLYRLNLRMNKSTKLPSTLIAFTRVAALASCNQIIAAIGTA